MKIMQTATGSREAGALGARLRAEYAEFVRTTGGNTDAAFRQLGQALLYATWSSIVIDNPVRDMSVRVYDGPSGHTIEVYKPGVPPTSFGLILSFGNV